MSGGNQAAPNLESTVTITAENFTTTIINIILSGDVHQARAWADAHRVTVAEMSIAQRSRVAHACRRWGIPGIIPLR
jgi:hypothetical protein